MRPYLLSFSFLLATPFLASGEIPTDYSQKMKPATMKILIAERAEGAILEVKGGYDLFNPETQLPITSSIMGKRAAVFSDRNGLKWGEVLPGVQQFRIVPSDAQSSVLVNGIEYRGCVEIYNLQGGLSIVNEIDIENFLKSTLSLDAPNVSDPKVLDALAIVARTNAYYMASRSFHKQWQVKSEECNYQGYGVTLQHLSVERAIENTKHIILSYKGQPFAATWTEDSAGRTASFSHIFRKQALTPDGVATPLAAHDREKHHWAFSLAKQELARLLGISKIVTITPYLDHQSEKTYGLRVSDGGSQAKDIDFFTLQKKLGSDHLRSNDFEIGIKGDKVVIKGWGKGHGVGLCLYSAAKLSQKGHSVAEILSQFFPSTELQNMRSLGHN